MGLELTLSFKLKYFKGIALFENLLYAIFAMLWLNMYKYNENFGYIYILDILGCRSALS